MADSSPGGDCREPLSVCNSVITIRATVWLHVTVKGVCVCVCVCVCRSVGRGIQSVSRGQLSCVFLINSLWRVHCVMYLYIYLNAILYLWGSSCCHIEQEKETLMNTVLICHFFFFYYISFKRDHGQVKHKCHHLMHFTRL